MPTSATVVVLTPSAYPEAVLKDGSREMTGDLTISKSVPVLYLNASGTGAKVMYQTNGVNKCNTSYNVAADQFWITDVDGAGVRLKMNMSDGKFTTLGSIATGAAIDFEDGIKADTVDESTAATGVTIDSMLVKDGVLLDAGYPNACLRDGSREIDYFSFTGRTELVISSGSITPDRMYHSVDTESGASTDDVDTVVGLGTRSILFLRPDVDGRSVVLKHATGNLLCDGSADITLDHSSDMVLLMYDNVTDKWRVSFFSNAGV